MTKTRIAALALVAITALAIAPALTQAQTYRTSRHYYGAHGPAPSHGGYHHGGHGPYGYPGPYGHPGGHGGYHPGGYPQHGGHWNHGPHGYPGRPNPYAIGNGVGQIIHGAQHGGPHGGAHIANGIITIVGGALGN